jgi:hypothetical protein
VDALIALSLLWKQLIQCTSSDECAIIHSLVPRYAFCPSARESVSSRTSTALTSDTYSDGFNEVKALGLSTVLPALQTKRASLSATVGNKPNWWVAWNRPASSR